MEAGLSRFGTDFGNGAADSRFFQFDAQVEVTLAAKRAVLSRFGPMPGPWCRTAAELDVHRAVLSWLGATLEREAPERCHGAPPTPLEPGEHYDFFARQLQEDFAVVHVDESGKNAVIAAHVCFPSGWRPERILGQDFLAIHAPIPEFERVGNASPALVSAMITRGPYVRFVWTLSADAALDHHPDHGQRASFADPGATGYLRVERQLTVPFPEVRASLFLIRTYLYPFDSLDELQRRDLGSAVEAMSPALRQYKGIWGFEALIRERLALPRLLTPREKT